VEADYAFEGAKDPALASGENGHLRNLLACKGLTIRRALPRCVTWYGIVNDYEIPENVPSVPGCQVMATKARAPAFVTRGQKVFAKSVTMPPQRQCAFMRPSVAEKLDYYTRIARRIGCDYGCLAVTPWGLSLSLPRYRSPSG